jgi:lipoprotein-anchoring transpeptidase ErfK/SrfK
VRVYTKFRSAAARKAQNTSHFHWLLVALLAGCLVWVWWKNLQHPSRTIASEQAVRVEVTPIVRSPRSGSTNPVAALIVAHNAAAGARDERPGGPRSARNIYEVQIALARQGISVGSLDGAIGSQTRAGLRAFQQREHLPVTGEADAATKAHLLLNGPLETNYLVTPDDLARLSPVGATWLAKSLQDRLDYETVLEMVAEKSHTHPNLIRMLNPSIDWNNVPPGTTLRVPDAEYPPAHARAAWIRIRLSDKTLEVWDAKTNLLAHFPCSIARQVEKRPVGRLQVETIALHPSYKFNPEIFPESEEARQLKRPLMIPQGPNNPVGTAWIGLNRPGYGIHGTPRPEDVGRTESHGCFRLANWNADYLTQLVEVGTPVIVEP